jgi:hypothetical protein
VFLQKINVAFFCCKCNVSVSQKVRAGSSTQWPRHQRTVIRDTWSRDIINETQWMKNWSKPWKTAWTAVMRVKGHYSNKGRTKKNFTLQRLPHAPELCRDGPDERGQWWLVRVCDLCVLLCSWWSRVAIVKSWVQNNEAWSCGLSVIGRLRLKFEAAPLKFASHDRSYLFDILTILYIYIGR